MERRILGRSGLEVGVVGLGVEHLIPERGNMDEVLDLAVSEGCEYIDLVYNDPDGIYAGHWKAITPALRRHRDRLTLAAHWGFVAHETIEHCRNCFERVLECVGNDYVEVAVLTMVDSESVWREWARESIQILRQYQKQGRVGVIGLSGHYPQVARVAVESGEIDVLMFPVNLYQHDVYPECRALLERCAESGVGVVAMKPYYGGRLLHSEGRPTGITAIQCLHYVLSQPVATVVPGARDADELRWALRYTRASRQEKAYEPLREQLSDRLRGQCVMCRHCLPCPKEISIPELISCLDYVEHYGHGPHHDRGSRQLYASMKAKGSDCSECGVCLERCPFHVDIIGKMRRAAVVFEGRS